MGKRRGSKKKQAKKVKPSAALPNLNVHTPSSTTGSKKGIKSKIVTKEQRKKNDMTWFVGYDQLKDSTSNIQKTACDSTTGNQEQEDFDRQLASLQERHQQQTQKKQYVKRRTDRRKGKRAMNASVAQHQISLTPASFSTQKPPATTQELVNDTVNQLSRFTDIGEQQPYRLSSLSSHLTTMATTTTPTATASKGDPNSFIAFQDSDDEDKMESSNAHKPSVPLFQFTPASFQVSSSSKVDENSDDESL